MNAILLPLRASPRVNPRSIATRSSEWSIASSNGSVRLASSCSGPHARGDASADSDVDLLIVMPLVGSRLATAVEIRKDLRGFGVAKDLVLLTPEEYERRKHIPGTIAWPAEHEGIVLHAA